VTTRLRSLLDLRVELVDGVEGTLFWLPQVICWKLRSTRLGLTVVWSFFYLSRD
jgi:hypothetical protein